MRKETIILISVIVVLFAVNYSLIDNALEMFLSDSETAVVGRVIDGDTLVIENKTSVRLLGINSPERGEKYYEEAKEFLEQRVLNRTIKLEFIGERYDKYNRVLAYIIYDNSNINLEVVENGFANYYFYSGRDKYSDDLLDAWENCIEGNINLCEKSENVCAQCISINPDNIMNTCSFSCNISNWQIKGEGREKFIFPEMLKPGEEIGFELDLTDSGGSLFLRDDEGGLVL